MYLNPFDNDVTIDFDNIAGTSCLMQLYNLSRRLVISIVLTSKGKIIMAN